jgi:hypothetical protein
MTQSGSPHPPFIPALRFSIRLMPSLPHEDACPHRPGMWGRVRRLRCRWNEHGLRGVPRPAAAGWRNEPTSGVLEPHALGGTPGVVGSAPLEAHGTGKRCRGLQYGAPIRLPLFLRRTRPFGHSAHPSGSASNDASLALWFDQSNLPGETGVSTLSEILLAQPPKLGYLIAHSKGSLVVSHALKQYVEDLEGGPEPAVRAIAHHHAWRRCGAAGGLQAREAISRRARLVR